MIVRVVAALIRNGDRFFICQRPPEKKRGLLWEFPGGKIEPGETPEQALIRECREELNAVVKPGRLYARTVHEYPDITVELSLYETEMIGGYTLLEHVDAKYIAPDETDDYAFCPADYPILAGMKNDLGGKA